MSSPSKEAKASTGGKKKEEEKVEAKPETPEQKGFRVMREGIDLVTRGIQSDEKRFVLRALRNIGRIRRALTGTILTKAINYALTGSDRLEVLLKHVGDAPAAMEVAGGEDAAAGPVTPPDGTSSIREVAMYAQMMVVVFLIDSEKFSEAADCAKDLIEQVTISRQRSGDEICARCYFYYARTAELTGKSGAIRGDLFAGLRTATLRKDEPGQAVLLNGLLRNFIDHNLIDQAQRLASKTVFPESAPNSEFARYLYYLGRIEAIQLEYSAAIDNIEQAIRKAPRNAVGFLQASTKLMVIVKMLLGNIPTRDVFRTESLRRSLIPYFELTQAVRIGDLSKFSAVIDKYGDVFRADKNYTLILRLRHNVIKTGVKMINVSYSRIALSDIAQKLQLDSAEDAEYIVAKCIRDGVIDATIDHDAGFVSSNETLNVYSTTEPQANFHQRIEFCMQTYDYSLKAMRYPPNAYRSYLESAEDRKKREQEEAEIAAEMDEMGDDEF